MAERQAEGGGRRSPILPGCLQESKAQGCTQPVACAKSLVCHPQCGQWVDSGREIQSHQLKGFWICLRLLEKHGPKNNSILQTTGKVRFAALEA